MSPTYINTLLEGIKKIYKAEYRQNFRRDSMVEKIKQLDI